MAIVCPTCRAVYVDGTLFCDQCGNWLIGVAAQPVEAAPDEQRAGSDGMQQRVGATGSSSTTTSTNISRPAEDADDVPWLKPLSGAQPVDDAGKDAPGTLPLPRRTDVDSTKLPVPGGGGPTRLRVLILNT